MPNSYFQFKQFIIHQEACAMKVSTDSCVFGAWLSQQIIHSLKKVHRILDIGAGTGLLMLMMAQEHACSIDGIELDASAFRQALSNIELSEWKHRLQLFHGDVRSLDLRRTYDLIVSNPPFYENDLLPVSERKAAAMHHTTLTFEELMNVVDRDLHPDGCCAFLIPYRRFDVFIQLAQTKGFYLHEVVHVRHQPDHENIRSMVMLRRNPAEPIFQSLVIKEKEGAYTASFKSLLGRYYLHI